MAVIKPITTRLINTPDRTERMYGTASLLSALGIAGKKVVEIRMFRNPEDGEIIRISVTTEER